MFTVVHTLTAAYLVVSTRFVSAENSIFGPHFPKPDGFKITPRFDIGLTADYVENWEFDRQGQYHDIAEVRVLVMHWDSNKQQMNTALHKTLDTGKIGHPGGKVDTPGVTLKQMAAEIVQTQAIGSTVNHDDLHLISAYNNYKLKGNEKVFGALFAVFLPDQEALQGPGTIGARNMDMTGSEGFVQHGYQWFPVGLSGWLTIPKSVTSRPRLSLIDDLRDVAGYAKCSKQKHPGFPVPPACKISPPALNDGLTLQDVQNWQYKQNDLGYKKAMANVAILHYDDQTGKLSIGLHRRNVERDPRGLIGHPGGSVDTIGENLADGAARELVEEALYDQPVTGNDLHLLKAKKLKFVQNGVEFYKLYAIYAVFVSDPDMVTGPETLHEWELMPDPQNDFSFRNRHRFFEIYGNQLFGIDDLQTALWFSTQEALDIIESNIHCT